MMRKKDIELLLSYHTKEKEKLEEQFSNREISVEVYSRDYSYHASAISTCRLILQID